MRPRCYGTVAYIGKHWKNVEPKKQDQQSKQDDQKDRGHQQEQGEIGWALQADSSLSADIPINLPKHPTTRRLRQAAVLQMQRQHGNEYVLRHLAQEPKDSKKSASETVDQDENGSYPIRNDDSTVRHEGTQLDPVNRKPSETESSIAPQTIATGEPSPVSPLPLTPSLLSRSPRVNVSPNATPAIQRWEAGTGGGKVDLTTPDLSKKMKLKYAVATLSAAGAIMAELKPKGEHKAGASAGGEGAKITAEVYKRAKDTGGSKFARLAREQVKSDEWDIEKVDWDLGVGAGESSSGAGEASVATGVKFTFVNGHETVVAATLFKKSASTGLDGPSASVEPVLKFPSITLWENKDAQLTFSGEVKFKMSLEPNWSQIFMELAKKGGRAVARNFARAALRGMVQFFLGAGGFILGGVITLGATAAALIEAQEVKKAIKTAEKAVDSYTRGYCVSWGVTQYGFGGIAGFFNEGKSAGDAKINEMIKKIQAHPVFGPYNFTTAEVRKALESRLSTAGPQVWKQVHGESGDRIRTQFVIEFYRQQEAKWLTSEYQAYKSARLVARVLGIDEDVIPRPKD